MTRRRTPVIATSIADPSIIHHFVSIKEAVEKGGFNQTSVGRCLRSPGSEHAGFTFTTTVTAEPPRASALNAEVRRLRAMGRTYTQISQQLSIAKSTVCYHLKAAL
ncbi:MAG: hypothetical protein ACRCTP_17805 [Aeromonas popoffii]|uniref:hypothetical protein n=1 Tax=Aeromonas popoffii TaxID=70856 RepID=UPI003F3F5710